MRVLAAGATGGVGRQLVPQLRARGHQVTATTTTASRCAALREMGAEAVVMHGLDAVRCTTSWHRRDPTLWCTR